MPFYSRLKRAFPAESEQEAIRKRTIVGLRRLRLALAAHFPKDTNRMTTVRVGTWNIREFGNTKYGGRDHL